MHFLGREKNIVNGNSRDEEEEKIARTRSLATIAIFKSLFERGYGIGFSIGDLFELSSSPNGKGRFKRRAMRVLVGSTRNKHHINQLLNEGDLLASRSATFSSFLLCC